MSGLVRVVPLRARFLFACAAVLGAGSSPGAGVGPRARHACDGAWLTALEIAERRGIPPALLARLEDERQLGPDDLCQIGVARLARAVRRAARPKPDNPLGWWGFRRLQLQDESGTIAEDGLYRAAAHVRAMRARRDPRRALAGINPGQWTWLGPGNVGGRIRSILTDPADPDRLWLGSVSGGIWTTADGGQSWTPVNDFLANLAVNAMAMDPTNADVMYAGTGEGFFPYDGIRGAGIFKSTNRGANWTRLASTATPDFWYVNRIAVSADGATLLAATWTGLHRSVNGGTSWTQVSSAVGYDVDFHPSDASRALAGSEGAILRSTNGGQSWVQATLPGSGTGRIEVAYARSSPGVVYAGANRGQGELWKSVDGGASFGVANAGGALIGANGWYDIALWVDPTDPDVVILGGLDLWRSLDGGTSFSQISVWYLAPQSAHADHHVVVAAPGYDGVGNRAVYFGNDGGIYRADDVHTVAGTSGWQELNNGLGITQFYGAAGIPASGTIVGGTQDNGTLLYTAAGGTEGWTEVFGGDGGFCAADPVNTDYLYGEYVVLDLFRSSNGVNANDGYINGRHWDGASYVWKSPPYLISDARDGFANFIAPFVLDPNTPNRLLAGGRSLWRTGNPRAAVTATTGPAWTAIKPPTATEQNISAIAVAPGNSSVVWVGHNDGDVYRTTNGTAASPTWTRVDGGPPGLPDRYVGRIALQPGNPNVAYVTFGGFAPDNVWRTTNAGASWSDVTGAGASGLPDVPVRSLVIHPDNPAWLYVGTEVGVFASENGGSTWSSPQDGPANVSVDELFFMDRTLVAATHGRGLYRAPTSSAAQVRVVGFGAVSTNAPEGAGSVSLAVRLTTSDGAPATAAVSVGYTTAGGTALAGADFTPATGTLSFPAGAASGSVENVSVGLLGDLLDEEVEDFSVSLSAATGATLGQAVHGVQVLDDDAPPALTLSDARVVEGDAGQVSAMLSVALSATSGRTVSAGYATADGSATVTRGSAGGTSSASIAIPLSGVATPYPSTLAVSGVAGTITKVRVGLHGFAHSYPSDVDVLLVGPLGQKVVLASDVGGSTAVTGVDLQIDDAGAALPSTGPLGSGTYRPTDLGGPDVYPAPAPGGPYAAGLAAFQGTSPNGTWSLYVRDEFLGDSGLLAGGWSLSFDVAAGDYQPAAGTLSFAPGVTSQTLSVAVYGDTLREPDETFAVGLSAVQNATLLGAQATVTIADDDTPRPAGLAFHTVTPCRVLDTRSAALGAPALLAGQSRTFTVAGRCAIPASAKAVSVNVTVTGPTSAGNLRLHPPGPLPLVSTVNYSAGQTRANSAVTGLGQGDLAVRCDQPAGSVHFILDVNGYFE